MEAESVMKRKTHWLTRWASFLTGICIGLLIVAPVLAAPQLALTDDALSSRPLLDCAQALFNLAAMLLTVILMRRVGPDPLSARANQG
jgi:hypothetical protein